MSDAVARESGPWRFAMRVLSFFGGLAAMLAIVGLIGIVWLVVAMQRRELGVRSALGATPSQLRRQVLSDALWTTGVASVVGVLGALVVGRVLAAFLVGSSGHDPIALVGAVTITICGGGVGCLLAAQGAARTDPMDIRRD